MRKTHEHTHIHLLPETMEVPLSSVVVLAWRAVRNTPPSSPVPNSFTAARWRSIRWDEIGVPPVPPPGFPEVAGIANVEVSSLKWLLVEFPQQYRQYRNMKSITHHDIRRINMACAIRGQRPYSWVQGITISFPPVAWFCSFRVVSFCFVYMHCELFCCHSGPHSWSIPFLTLF